ncbi:Dabb family protein [candidate division KSB1 bacterium]|nr:Dabb family protein [candidate division KSB1 bacterium]
MIKHIVMWKVKETNKKANTQRIKEILEALPTQIPEIIKLEVGINVNTGAAAYDVVLYSAFDSVDALNIYQDHPAHQKVKEFIGSVVSERAVVDYER